jgi:hypothetical protein
MTDELITAMRGLLSVSGAEVNTSTSSNGTNSTQEDKKPMANTKKPMANTDANEADGIIPLFCFVKALLITFPETLFEVVISHGKGSGLFAKRSIPRGTRIIIEAPLLAVPTRNRDKFFELHRGNEARIAEAQEILSQQSQALRGASRHDEILDAIAIFLVNRVGMGQDGCDGSGIFEHYCRINHACNPNVQCSFNPLLEKLTVHATRQINKGDEILTSYIDSTCTPREDRQRVLNYWGFKCGCTCCTGPNAAAGERRRTEMHFINHQLDLYERSLQIPGVPVPDSPRAALKLCESLLELYRLEETTDYNLATLLVSHCSLLVYWEPC